MKIEVFLDEQETPRTVIDPPESFHLDTTELADGPHVLSFRARDTDGSTSVRDMRFTVRNGPGIAVHGIREGDLIKGQVAILANAYSSRAGDTFEPMRIETPAPIPTWAWLIFLLVFAWGMWYLGIEWQDSRPQVRVAGALMADTERVAATDGGDQAWRVLGERVYGNNCASCHQVSGAGLPGVFPPLKGNAAVTAADPSEHVGTILRGLTGKAIDGVAYASPMPPFGAQLGDAEIAAVVNHERTNWGNAAPTVTAEEVAALR